MNDLLNLLADFNINLIKLITPIFKEEGYTFNELAAMWKIMKKGPCRPADLMHGTFVPGSTFTSIFDRLEARGMVKREKDPNDRRSTFITGTPELYTTNQRIIAKCVEKLNGIFSQLPPETLESLKDSIGKANNLINDKTGQKGCTHHEEK